jgi:dTDP-4-dehydrorhamnose 3,5-epimerase/reductase
MIHPTFMKKKLTNIATEIPGAMILNHDRYGKQGVGMAYEVADFSEIAEFGGVRFDARSMYAIESVKGMLRGGHMESRSKLVTILDGMVYYVLVDMRAGSTRGRVCQFRLGNGSDALGQSVLVPEGVVDAFVSLTETSLYVSVADQPYNLFDAKYGLNMFDKKLSIKWPRFTQEISHGDKAKILSFDQFVANI